MVATYVSVRLFLCFLLNTHSGNWHPRPPAGINMTLGFSHETGNLKFEVTAEAPSPGKFVDVYVYTTVLSSWHCTFLSPHQTGSMSVVSWSMQLTGIASTVAVGIVNAIAKAILAGGTAWSGLL